MSVLLALARRTRCAVPVFLLLSVLFSSSAEPQATVQALARGLQPLEETTDVRLTRFADFADELAVRIGMELEPGDLLASGGRVDLELSCPGGSVLRFTGSYRVLVDVPGEGVDCAVNFLSGTVDVLTDQPTEVQAGGVVLGSEGTQYTVELSRDPQRPQGGRGGLPPSDVNCQVYDGRVSWRLPQQKVEWVSAGKNLRVVEGTVDVVEIDRLQIVSTADRYARFDLAHARAAGLRIADDTAAIRDLAQVHEKVLAKPRDTDLRVDLAKTQLRYSLSPQAAYNLRSVGVQTDEQIKLHKIDPQKLRAVSSSGLRLSPSGGTPSSPPPAAPDPWTLIQQKEYKRAIELGLGKVKDSSATSRDYYALAFAYRELEGRGSRGATDHAKRAVRLGGDGLLTEAELRRCKSWASGGY